jgi:hypothetical protein
MGSRAVEGEMIASRVTSGQPWPWRGIAIARLRAAGRLLCRRSARAPRAARIAKGLVGTVGFRAWRVGASRRGDPRARTAVGAAAKRLGWGLSGRPLARGERTRGRSDRPRLPADAPTFEQGCGRRRGSRSCRPDSPHDPGHSRPRSTWGFDELRAPGSGPEPDNRARFGSWIGDPRGARLGGQSRSSLCC